MIFFYCFVILQLADLWTTYVGLNKNIAHEVNPVMRFLFSNGHILPILILTKAICLIVAWELKDNILALKTVNLIYFFIVFRNFLIINRVTK